VADGRPGGGSHGGVVRTVAEDRTAVAADAPVLVAAVVRTVRVVKAVVRAAEDPGGPGGPGGGPRRGKRQYFRKKKVCRFCVERVDFIDYKKAEMLQPFVQERGKILAAAHHRHLLAPSALAGRSHQARAQHRIAAVRHGALIRPGAVNE
jgi:small subunit ribosomal protein S18